MPTHRKATQLTVKEIDQWRKNDAALMRKLNMFDELVDAVKDYVGDLRYKSGMWTIGRLEDLLSRATGEKTK